MVYIWVIPPRISHHLNPHVCNPKLFSYPRKKETNHFDANKSWLCPRAHAPDSRIDEFVQPFHLHNNMNSTYPHKKSHTVIARIWMLLQKYRPTKRLSRCKNHTISLCALIRQLSLDESEYRNVSSIGAPWWSVPDYKHRQNDPRLTICVGYIARIDTWPPWRRYMTLRDVNRQAAPFEMSNRSGWFANMHTNVYTISP